MSTSLLLEDINYLRLSSLLLRLAPRAVRRKFNYEFHPVELQKFLRKSQRKINDLILQKRVITKAQFDTLYPSGSSYVASDMFDVSLMVFLLRHFTDMDIQDSLPSEQIHTNAADISRIKYYRNYIVHSDSGKVSEQKFSEIWNCVVEAILRLEPDLKSDIGALICSPLTYNSDIIDFIRLEKEMDRTNHQLSTVNQKMETLEIENNNIKEMHNRSLKEWKDTDKKYVSTSATAFILQALKDETGVIITGSPGCGKSVAAHHVALKLEKEGYEIILCDDSSDILKHLTTEKMQVFVIDDVCGKFALNQHKADSWEQNDGKLNMLIELNQNDDNEDSSNKSEIKFIITCREDIYGHKAFPKLTCFSLVQCSLSTKYKISPDEMRNIALSYLPENTVNDIDNICLYDFFPLLCALYCKKTKQDPSFFIRPVEIIEKEISKMKIKSETSFVCLSLLVLNNNKCLKDELKSSGMEQVVQAICRDSKFETVVSNVSILKSFERLEGIYITESDNLYTAIHDKMFDIISAAIAPFIMNCLIENVDIAFLVHRIQLSSCNKTSLPFVINIPPEFENKYLKRQFKEAMKGKYWEVFGSMQAENETYRKLLLSFLKEQDSCQVITYIPGEDGATPLFVSSYLGYVDFVKYFIVKSPDHIDLKDKKGRSSFYVACENGHITMVRYLMKFYPDINAENVEKTTALSATCLKGYTKMVHLLLDNNAETNKTNKLNQSTLHCACLNGNVKLVQLLLNGEYNLDITIRDTFGKTALHVACEKGHIDIVKTLMEFGMDINQTQKNGKTPLYLACKHGCYDIVKYITCCIDSDQKKRTVADELTNLHSTKNRWTVLHTACQYEHIEVVNLLINVGMNVNDTTNEGFTPLHLACRKGHFATVKFLLALNNQTSNSCVHTTTKDKDGWSVLHAACSNGNIEVAKLLIGVGMNLIDISNNGSTPLYIACQKGHFDIVKLLLDLTDLKLKKCVGTIIKRLDGWSVLHAACSNGHIEVVKLLIAAGLNVNETTHKGYTPLILSCLNGHYDTVKYLLALNGETMKSCVDTFIKRPDGWSALHAASSNGNSEVVKLLIDVGMNANDITNNGSTPLYLACQNGHFIIVKYLLDLNNQTSNSCVDTTLKDKAGLSVLHTACLNGRTEVVKYLIDVGMNVNERTNNGSTPLYIACHRGNYDIVDFLLGLSGKTLNSGVDTIIKRSEGWSALHAACSNGNLRVAQLLIDVGMNVNDTTDNGSTPLNLACQNGHYQTVKYLVDLNSRTLNRCANTMIKRSDGWSPLHSACSNGHTELIQLLIDIGLNVNDTTNKNYTPFYIACKDGHYETVKFLLDLKGKTFNCCVDTTMEDTDGCSALHAACSNGHLEVVKLLIGVGMNVNVTSKKGLTPLFLACHRGHYDTVKFLLGLFSQTLTTNIDTPIKRQDGLSHLHAACSNGHTEVVKLLVDAGFDVNDTTNKRSTPLFFACLNGHYDIVNFLLNSSDQTFESRADTINKCQDRWSVSQAACANGHLQVVKLLIDFGMNVNDITNNGSTSLYLACRNGHYDTVKYLLDLTDQTLNKSVDTVTKRQDRLSALHAASLNGHTEVVKLLINYGLSVNDTSYEECTPLYLACHRGHYDTVKFLLDLNGQTWNSCVDATIKKNNGWSVLHIASSDGHTEIVKLLIDIGIKVNDTTNNGSTSLYLACHSGHSDTVKFLLGLNGQTLNSRVDTLIKRPDEWSALHAACSNGHKEVVKLLIDYGMDVNDTTNKGSAPLYLACQNGHYDTVKYLLDLNGQTLNSCVDTLIKRPDGWSVLHAACSNGHTEVVKLLIDVEQNVNEKTKQGSTILHLACQNGHYDTVEFLLDIRGQKLASHVDTSRKDTKGWSALHTACSNGHSKVANLLICFGMNVNDTTNNGSTIYHLACHNGHNDTVKLLLDFNDQTFKSLVDIPTNVHNGWSVLHTACWVGHTEVVKLLVENGMNVNEASNKGSTPLFLACYRGHYETVKYLLDLNGQTLNSCVDTLIKRPDGWSVLHAACSNGHTEVVKLLIDVEKNVNEKTKQGSTPLYLACQNGHFNTVNFILYFLDQPLDSRVDITIKDAEGWSALHTACSNGHLKVVKLLIRFDINVNEATNKDYTPLHLACQNGHYDTVKYLLDLNGQTLNICVNTIFKRPDGLSAVHSACSNGHTEVVKLLIEVGMNINDTTQKGSTPLYLACKNGHYDTVKFLLDSRGKTLNSGVNTNMKDNAGLSALHTACSNGHPELIMLLVGIGLEINDTTHNYSTPLYLACQNGHYDTVKFLLDLNGQTLNSCVDTLIKRPDEWSALHAACSNGHTEVVRLLIDYGMDLNEKTNNSSTPLYLACQNGHYDTVKYIIDLRGQTLNICVDTTIKDNEGCSVLHAASLNGHPEIVKLLISAGFPANDTTHNGSTPLYLACQNGHYSTVKYLLDLNGQTLNSCVNTTIKDNSGWSVLHAACWGGHTVVVKALVNVNSNVNDTTNEGYSPLSIASARGHFDTVKFLLNLNSETLDICVDTTITDRNGKSAFNAAFSNGHREVVKLFIDEGISEVEKRKTKKKYRCVLWWR